MDGIFETEVPFKKKPTEFLSHLYQKGQTGTYSWVIRGVRWDRQVPWKRGPQWSQSERGRETGIDGLFCVVSGPCLSPTLYCFVLLWKVLTLYKHRLTPLSITQFYQFKANLIHLCPPLPSPPFLCLPRLLNILSATSGAGTGLRAEQGKAAGA